MRSWRVCGNEEKYLKELLNGGFPGKSEPGFTGRLEAEFAEKFGVKFAISFANGTATLHAALHALGIGPGDEVIVPPLTMSSTTLAVLHAGAKPVYADVDRETFVMSVESAKKKITSRTKAIMPVSLYGLPAPVPELKKLGLPVVEDSAQCFLGSIDGKLAGAIGDLGSFSFQNSKHITCGEGGMVITDDPELAAAVRRFSSLGYGQISPEPGKSKIDKNMIASPETIRHTHSGFNFRMSELCAAFTLAQLENLDKFVAMRKMCGEAFFEAASGCSWLQPQKSPAGTVNSFWAAAFCLDTGFVSWEDFHKAMIAAGSDGYYGAWRLAYHEPALAYLAADADCPNAEYLQSRMVQLKTHYGSEEELDKEVAIFRQVIKHFDR